MTTRGATEKDFDIISEFLDQGIKETIKISKQLQSSNFKEFKENLSDGSAFSGIDNLKRSVIDLCHGFDTIGFDK